VLSAQGKKIAQSQGLACAAEGEARDKQMQVNDDLPRLREHVQRGRYVEAVSMANRLLGMGQLTGNQVVYITVSAARSPNTCGWRRRRSDHAREATRCGAWAGDTSPRVLHVLEVAKQALGGKPRAPVTAEGLRAALG
jgi:hypothetical protein